LYTKKSPRDPEMKNPDYIIVGSGPAGCVLANRLGAHPNTRVWLLEAGGSDRKLKIAMPAAVPYAYQDSALNWGEKAGPEPSLNGASIDEKRGMVLGGGTSINAMIFNRGNPRDYDGWAASGLDGWGWKDVLPYFKRMETFDEGGATRGVDGPVKVIRCPAKHHMFDLYMKSGEQAGHRRPVDHNSGDQEGMHIAQALIDNGRRCSASHAYLKPAMGRANLKISTGVHVDRILFDGDRATGVQFSTGERHYAAKEVIIAASTVGAAKLLLLSGVGPADELRALGIEVVLDHPHVGKNLENHPGVNLQYTSKRSDSILSELGPMGQMKLGLQWLLAGRGLGASNFFEAGAFLKTHEKADYANVQFEFLPLYRKVENGKINVYPGFQLWIDLSRPASRGTVRLTSADPAQKPEIVFNHFEEREDQLDIIRSIRMARELFRQSAWDGVRGDAVQPQADLNTDVELLSWVKQATGTSYHPTGTCRMSRDIKTGVVDKDCRVHGLKNLRVVCGAVMPKNVTGNLSAPIYMIGEKMAERIGGGA
jgi:choline dehydrogenase